MRDYYTKEEWTDRLAALKKRIESVADGHESVFLDLGGARKVRLVLFAQEARDLIQRELKWVLTDATDEFDATVYLWKESDMISFARHFFVFPGSIEENEYLLIKVKGGDESFFPCGQLNVSARTIHLVEDNTYFFGAESFAPERWLSEGHILVQMLFRIMNTASNARLVHGACIGLDNKGLLLCARGQRGKSTLAVTAMVEGFDYVSEDYLILNQENNKLYASPVYSIISLSPFMYDKLYDGLDKARFVGVSHWKGKYVFDISAYADRLKRHYPIRACLFPEISTDVVEPRVELCDSKERNSAITQVAHSTLLQMWSRGLKQHQSDQAFILDVIRMLNGMEFYKIILTPDIYKNAECLEMFLLSLDS